MRFKWLFILALAIFSSSSSYAHEGHSIPGALPPAPHGGNVEEAMHLEEEDHAAHDHERGDGEDEGHTNHPEEVELFMEAIYSNKRVTIYPLALLPTDTKSFVELSPKKDLSNIKVKIEIPRTKAMIELSPKVEAESISVDFDAKKINRFIVHVMVEHEKELKLAKVQIENY